MHMCGKMHHILHVWPCKGTHQPLQYPAADPAFPAELQNLQCSALANLSPGPWNSGVQGEVHCSNCEVQVFWSSRSAQGRVHSALGPDPGGCVGWGHSLKCLKVCLWGGLASLVRCLAARAWSSSEESGWQEREVVFWDLCIPVGMCWPATASRGDWATYSVLLGEQEGLQKVIMLAGSTWKQTGWRGGAWMPSKHGYEMVGVSV